MLMRRILFALAAFLALATPAKAQNSTIAALTAASALTGPELLYGVQGGADRKVTVTQVGTFIWSQISGDCTASGGVITCTKTNGVAFAPSATTDATNATNITSGSLALARIATIGANTVLGSIAGGIPAALTQTQLTSLINVATTSLSGALPAWPNDATKFFGGDGVYRTAITQITFGNGSSGGVCTTTCSVSVQETINSLTGTNPAILTAAWGQF